MSTYDDWLEKPYRDADDLTCEHCEGRREDHFPCVVCGNACCTQDCADDCRDNHEPDRYIARIEELVKLLDTKESILAAIDKELRSIEREVRQVEKERMAGYEGEPT